MIRRSLTTKMTLLITGLVLLVLAALYIALTQLFHNTAFESLIETPSGQSFSGLINTAQWLFVLAGVGAILLASGLAIILSNQLAQPLLRMALVTQSMIAGNYKARVHIAGHNEVARLGDSINELANSLGFLQTSRNQFLADIAHELRTPLSYIHGYAQVLADGLFSTEEEQINYLNIIREESARIERLIENLFDLAKADEGVLTINPSETDVKELIQNVIAHLRPTANKKDMQLVLGFDIERPVQVDPIRLEQVVFNLVENAIRYTPPQGIIRITAVETSGVLEIQVSDNGPGIPAEDLPHIWDRLYRVEKSRSRNLGGTGLGLAIVKQIVELHGGSVFVQSKPGQGTSARIRIPAIVN